MSKVKKVHSHRAAFDPHVRVTLDTGAETPVKQAMKAECDINTIMARYRETGVITHGRAGGEGRFDDVSELGDYQDCLETVRRGQEVFETLPAKVRARFSNDPGEFVQFATNPDNVQEMVDLGLLPGKPSKGAAEPADKRSAEADRGTVQIESAPTGASEDE